MFINVFGEIMISSVVRATDLYRNLTAELKLVSDLKRKFDDIDEVILSPNLWPK